MSIQVKFYVWVVLLGFGAHGSLAQEAAPWMTVVDPDDKVEEWQSLRVSANVKVSDGLSYQVSTLYIDPQRAIFKRTYPDRVANAAERVGCRLTLGTWGWDVEEGPYAGPVDEVLEELWLGGLASRHRCSFLRIK